MNNVLFKNKYRIKSSRLRNWDYSHDGVYSVTICTKNRELYFGNIKNDKIKLSKIGEIARNNWLEIPKHFSFVALDYFMVMPNHIHGIIEIRNGNGNCRDAINRVSTFHPDNSGGITKTHNSMLHPGSLSTIIRWFKGRTTFEINKTNIHFQWQPRFYDHIVRDEKSLNQIRKYIHNNPLKWEFDRNNPEQMRKGG
jgi:REP element-mobilizing transposase RayT